MKPCRFLHRISNRLPPQSWPDIYAVITIMLVGFLTLAFLLDALKATLP